MKKIRCITKEQVAKNLLATIMFLAVLTAQFMGRSQWNSAEAGMAALSAPIIAALIIYTWLILGQAHLSFCVTKPGLQVFCFHRFREILPWNQLDIVLFRGGRGGQRILLMAGGKEAYSIPYRKERLRTLLLGMMAYRTEFQMEGSIFSHEEHQEMKRQAQSIRNRE